MKMFFQKIFLMSVLILAITFGVSIPNSDKSNHGMMSLQGIAFAQSPPDFTSPPDFADNSTADMSPPDTSQSDLSTPDSTALNDTIPDPESDLSNSDLSPTAPSMDNMSSSATSLPNSSVPEFGTLSSAILIIAVMSFVVISTRTRLKFT